MKKMILIKDDDVISYLFKFPNIDDAFVEACIDDKVKPAKCLLDFKNIQVSDTAINKGFIYSCMYGNKKIIAWLYYELFKEKFDLHLEKDSAMVYACKNDHFVIVKWLHTTAEKENAPFDLKMFDDLLFRDACKSGHTILAQWLYSKGDFLDAARDWDMFCKVCDKNKLETAVWLYNLNKWSKENLLEIYDKCMVGYCPNVCKWLHQLVH